MRSQNARFFWVAINLIAICGCATPPSRHPNSDSTSEAHEKSVVGIKIDPNLLLNWTAASADVSTAKSPALYRFKYANKSLRYLAARHSSDSNSDTFQIIKDAFKKSPPTIVIVEGFPTSLGFNSKQILASVSPDFGKESYTAGEPAYTIELASRDGVDFVGGEPDDHELFKIISSAGFSADDLIAYSFVRQIPQSIRAGNTNQAAIADDFRKYASWKIQSFGLPFSFSISFEKFKNWYEKNQGKIFDPLKIENGESSPITDGKLFTQKIAAADLRARDEHIIDVISDCLNSHSDVLIVYGSSHYRIEHRAIEASLGPAQM